MYRDTEPMLSGHPAIANVFTIDRGWKQEDWTAQMAHEWRLLRALRARHYDLIVHLTENPRGAVLSLLLKPPYSVARDYPAKRGRLWRNSFTHLYQASGPAPYRGNASGCPAPDRHLSASRTSAAWCWCPGPRPSARCARLLARHGLAPKGFIHLHPTSRWMFKSWEVDKNAALIMALQEAGEPVVLTAAPSEPELQYAARVTARLKKPVVDLSGKLNLKQLAALTAQAKCFVGVDSVPMHIAAAMQTPTVVLFGPSGEFEWGPWQVQSRVLTSHHSCRPCGQDGCGNSKISECLTSIPVEQVFNAVRELLR